MLLPALVALPAAAGSLLCAAREPSVQVAVHAASAAGLGLWLAARLLLGYLPLPSTRNLAWAAALLSGALLSMATAPRPDALGGLDFLQALWMFPAMAALSKDERVGIDQAVRACAWVLMVLAFYQRVHLGQAPSGTFGGSAAYAGAVLLWLPLAVERKDWLLATGLAVTFLWSAGVGAWLGLFAALALTRRWRPASWSWVGRAGVLACLAWIYGHFESPELLERAARWREAALAAWARPWTGWGPGAFPETGQYWLQVAADWGLPFASLWFAGLAHCLGRGSTHKRFAVLCVLIQGCWDGALSEPAILWLLAYCAASSIPESSRGVNVDSRLRLPASAAAAASGASLALRLARLP